MTDEPTIEDISTDDNDPANKGFVREEINKLAQTTQKGFDELRSEVQKSEKRIINEFKVVAENIHKDVASANTDEISLIKDQKIPDHEGRLQVLEDKAGVAVGPRS